MFDVFSTGIFVHFHHGGCFVRDWLVCYKGGEETLVEGIEDDKFSYFEITGMVENDFKVEKPYRLWWMSDVEVTFRVLRLDVDANDIKESAQIKLCTINIFVEHNDDENRGLVDIPSYVGSDEEGESS